MSPPRLQEHWAKVQASAARHGRNPDELILVNSLRVAVGDSAANPIAEPLSDLIQRATAYRDLGVNHLTVSR